LYFIFVEKSFASEAQFYYLQNVCEFI